MTNSMTYLRIRLMKFYTDITQHIKMINDGLFADLNLNFVDRTELNLDTGLSGFTYVIGNVIPTNTLNADGQQGYTVSVELQLFFPTSLKTITNEDAQFYAVGVSTKVMELLRRKNYGIAGQKEKPEIEGNYAAPLATSKSKSFLVRSVLFNQIVYVGDNTLDLRPLDWELVIHAAK